MWWRLELFLRGLAIRFVRGRRSGIAPPEMVLLHQAILRLERRIEVLEASEGDRCIEERQGKSDVR